MRKTTDINGLRSVAKMMLHLPMTETEFDFIVSHPMKKLSTLRIQKRRLRKPVLRTNRK